MTIFIISSSGDLPPINTKVFEKIKLNEPKNSIIIDFCSIF